MRSSKPAEVKSAQHVGIAAHVRDPTEGAEDRQRVLTAQLSSIETKAFKIKFVKQMEKIEVSRYSHSQSAVR